MSPDDHGRPDGTIATERLSCAGRPTPFVRAVAARLAPSTYSTEVEHALLAHCDVQDCPVFGLPNEKWGQRVAAVVKPRAGADLVPDQATA